jgi:hypothetical protein
MVTAPMVAAPTLAAPTLNAPILVAASMVAASMIVARRSMPNGGVLQWPKLWITSVTDLTLNVSVRYVALGHTAYHNGLSTACTVVSIKCVLLHVQRLTG